MDSANKRFVLSLVCGVIFCLNFLCFYGFIEVPDNSYNVTEHIVSKDKWYTYRFMDTGFKCYVFTEDYCFEVDIDVFNRLNVNDTIVVTDNGRGSAWFVYEGHRFFSD